ncbi:MAG: flagellar hook assembly protein FlgD [Treponema sp.]|nr:flagellar hook assembly protein FlgD [Treponema sp.]
MAQIQSVLNAQDLAELNRNVTDFNAKLRSETQQVPQQEMGKDEFLKLLVTQLANQDPTAPMEDKEFISQMAQFSSLEQMTNMAADFAKLARMMTGSEATNALGRTVEIQDGDNVIHGSVQAVSREDNPQVMVGGSYYHWDQVTKVYNEGDENL